MFIYLIILKDSPSGGAGYIIIILPKSNLPISGGGLHSTMLRVIQGLDNAMALLWLSLYIGSHTYHAAIIFTIQTNYSFSKIFSISKPSS